MSTLQEILEFWFGKPGEEEYGQYRPIWFQTNETHVEEARRRFLPIFEQAEAGALSAWEATPEGRLALVLLLDQFSFLLFPNTARSFGTDAEARRVARLALERGDEQQFPELLRWFLYLPFEHSEDRADQELSVRLFRSLEPNEVNQLGVDFAERHQRVIERFGRFPNRNIALGRESTPEELEFLAGPDAPF